MSTLAYHGPLDASILWVTYFSPRVVYQMRKFIASDENFIMGTWKHVTSLCNLRLS